MNRWIPAVLAGLLLVAVPRAQATDDAQAPAKKGEHEMKWAGKMGLTDEEAGKLKEAFKAEREAAKPLRRGLRDALTKLHDQVQDKASDKDLQASLDRVDQAREALRAEHEKFRKKVAGMIPVEKRAKIALMMAHRRKHGMRGHEGKSCGRDGKKRGRWGRGEKGERGDRKGREEDAE